MLLSRPEYVQHVLQNNAANYWQRPQVERKTAPIVGDGLFLADGGSWLRQRRMLQPQFEHDQVAPLAAMIGDSVQEKIAEWRSIAERGEPVDMAAEMWRLAGTVILRAIFGAELTDRQCDQLIRTIDIAVGHVERQIKYLAPSWAPLPGGARSRRALARIDAFIDAQIARRRREREERGDLLSMLLRLRDPASGEPLTDTEIRDEVMTLYITGQQPAGTTLGWLWYLLSQHPDAQRRLEEEVTHVTGGLPPSPADLPKLPYLRAVISETLRLYPPVYVFFHTAFEDDEIDGYHIPAKALVSCLTYAVQRDPAYWERPNDFEPERFLSEDVSDRPAFAYFPFGGGPRACIGRHLGMMELQLAVATITQAFRPRLVPGAVVKPNPVVLLGMAGSMPMTLTPR